MEFSIIIIQSWLKKLKILSLSFLDSLFSISANISIEANVLFEI